MVDRLTIVTPWYPSATKPFGGAFVRSQAIALADVAARLDVLHLDEWPLPTGSLVQRRVRADTQRLLSSPRTRPRAIQRDEAHVTRLPVPALRRSFARNAESAETVLRAALPGGVIDADVVHAHVGLPAGLAAVRCARPDAVVAVTEHATFLDQMWETAEGRQRYDEVLTRCSVFICVSELLRDEVVMQYPHHAEKITVVPNVVPFETIPPRPTPVSELRRWLYVGAFSERKGVGVLLEAFAMCHDQDPSLRLTMVGGGAAAEELVQRSRQLGIHDAVDVRGAVPPDAVFDLYHTHDLLVHASRYETFGMTIVEALAAGMPVLVTRCGGPEETLAGLEEVAGQLVDVSDDPVVLANGYWQLRGRADQLNLGQAREHLAGRYGARAVSSQLADLYTDPGARP